MGSLGPTELLIIIGVLSIPLAVVAGGLWVFAKSPFGRALVERIRGGRQDTLLVQRLEEEVEGVREELT